MRCAIKNISNYLIDVAVIDCRVCHQVEQYGHDEHKVRGDNVEAQHA